MFSAKTLLLAAGLTVFSSVAALAADHQVMMLNKDTDGRAMQFEPAFLRVEPGDTVTFVPTNPSHNSETVADAIPEGAEPWKGGMNKEITVTLTEEGLYAYKCLPHFGMGMVGLIQVGDSTENLEAVESAKYPGKAKDRMAELIEEMQAAQEM